MSRDDHELPPMPKLGRALVALLSIGVFVATLFGYLSSDTQQRPAPAGVDSQQR